MFSSWLVTSDCKRDMHASRQSTHASRNALDPINVLLQRAVQHKWSIVLSNKINLSGEQIIFLKLWFIHMIAENIAEIFAIDYLKKKDFLIFFSSFFYFNFYIQKTSLLLSFIKKYNNWCSKKNVWVLNFNILKMARLKFYTKSCEAGFQPFWRVPKIMAYPEFLDLLVDGFERYRISKFWPKNWWFRPKLLISHIRRF